MPPSTSAAPETLPRLFVEAPLREGGGVAASETQRHYLMIVLRRAAGDRVRLFNGADGEWIARLAPEGGRRGALMLVPEAKTRTQSETAGPWLLFAQLKRDTTGLIIRQATELGVARIVPVRTARTIAQTVNIPRLRAIAIEAAEQSERLDVPIIEAPARLNELLAAWPRPDGPRRLAVALERSGGWSPIPQPDPAGDALLVGPEGGFTPDEQRWLRGLAFVVPLSLGALVLPAETAAAAGLARLPRPG